MKQRNWSWTSWGALGVAVLWLVPSTAQAQITRVSSNEHKHAIGFNVGYFAVKGEDSRVSGDVLVADLVGTPGTNPSDALAFRLDDFSGATFGGEWLMSVGKYVETGVGVSYYQHTVPSVYLNYTNTNGSEIEQDLKLRTTPLLATVRFLPAGHGKVEPYVGAGLGVFFWRYSEVGQFLDTSDNSIFRDQYVASGTAVGPVVLGGIRFPVGVWAIGGEIRYQKAEGDTKPEESRLLGPKIDLGGWTTNFTVHLRF